MTTVALLLALLVQVPATDASTEAERTAAPSVSAAPVPARTQEGTEVSQAPRPEDPAAAVDPSTDDGASPVVTAEYQVGPGDGLDVTVIGNVDLSRIPTVQTNGAILLPLLGEVQVAGLTVGRKASG